jgi:hypothetical protein
MSIELAGKNAPMRRRPRRRNWMACPRELRRAIPNLHAGRVLELDSIRGQASHTSLAGRLVELKLVVKETGKLTGEYVVVMTLQVDAARKLAATLTRLADEAERLEPVDVVKG